MSKFITPKELADELQVDLNTLYKWRMDGVGPHGIRVGRYLRYSRAEVDRWLAEREQVEHERYSQAK